MRRQKSKFQLAFITELQAIYGVLIFTRHVQNDNKGNQRHCSSKNGSKI